MHRKKTTRKYSDIDAINHTFNIFISKYLDNVMDKNLIVKIVTKLSKVFTLLRILLNSFTKFTRF